MALKIKADRTAARRPAPPLRMAYILGTEGQKRRAHYVDYLFTREHTWPTRTLHVVRTVLKLPAIRKLKGKPLHVLDVGVARKWWGYPTTEVTMRELERQGFKPVITAVDEPEENKGRIDDGTSSDDFAFQGHEMRSRQAKEIDKRFVECDIEEGQIAGKHHLVLMTNVGEWLKDANRAHQQVFEQNVAEGGVMVHDVIEGRRKTYGVFQKIGGVKVLLAKLPTIEAAKRAGQCRKA